jgi:hypothetical protein
MKTEKLRIDKNIFDAASLSQPAILSTDKTK